MLIMCKVCVDTLAHIHMPKIASDREVYYVNIIDLIILLFVLVLGLHDHLA